MITMLTRDEVEAVLTMGDTVDVVEEAFRQYALGTVEVPLRIHLRTRAYDGFHGVMLGYVGGDVDALAVKLASFLPQPPAKPVTSRGTMYIVLFDPVNGSILSLMDGHYITAMRTGAVCGVATKYLARADAQVLGQFGAGVQGRTQVRAVHEVRPLKLVKVFDPVPGKAAEFSQELSAQLDIEVKAVEKPRSAVAGCHVICVAARTKTPVFEAEWLEEGTHVNAIGSSGPDVQELDSDTVARAKVVVDSKEAILVECGDLIVPIKEGRITDDHIYAELGDLITGAKEGRSGEREITLFKSVGLALQDAAAAAKAYQLAKEKGLGSKVDV